MNTKKSKQTISKKLINHAIQGVLDSDLNLGNYLPDSYLGPGYRDYPLTEKQMVKQNKGYAGKIPRGRPVIPSSMSGSSRYEGPVVSNPVSTSRSWQNSIPSVRKSARGVRITHQEMYQTYTATSLSFSGLSFPVNPGLAVFPWLSTQANGYEQYRFHRLSLKHVPRCSTATAGVVMLAPDYDISDQSPDTEPVLMALKGAIQDTPWSEFECRLDPSSMFSAGSRKFVRSALVPGQDLKLYDSLTMYVYSNDLASLSVTGSLVWDYDVEFFNPCRPVVTGPPAPLRDIYQILETVPFVMGTGFLYVNFNAFSGDAMGWPAPGPSMVVPRGNWLIQTMTEVHATSIGLINACRTAVYKNGAAVGPGTNYASCQILPQITVPAVPNTFSLAGFEIFTSNGSDTLSLYLECLFAGGGTMAINGVRLLVQPLNV